MKLAKRFLSVLLSLCLVLGMIPGMAFAAGSNLPFTDVDTSAWYHDAVEYVYENGMMTGVTTSTFSPNGTTTRAMIVTILHRLDGAPSATGTAFTDVPANQWYTGAVAWASSNNIVGGYGDGRFGPSDPVTREQMAIILYRYSQHKGYDTDTAGEITGFADAGQVNSYATQAMRWAVGCGLITGVDGRTLAPRGTATRAEVATMFMRFCTTVALPGGTATVTFNSNGGSSVQSQSVQAGRTATRPADPTRTGYTFVGWYDSSDLVHLYDFSAAVTRNITLYARWDAVQEEEHTFLDDREEGVEIYSFTADIWDIPVGSGQTVTFTAEVFANTGSDSYTVTVVDESGQVIATMNDAGNGIYTAQANLSSRRVETRRYYAQCGTSQSPDVTIGYYQEYTTAQMDKLTQVVTAINTAMAQYLDDEGYVNEGELDRAVSALERELNRLKGANDIASYEVTDGAYVITLSNGLEYRYAFREHGVDGMVVISNQPFKNTYNQTLQAQSDDAADGSARNVANTFEDYRFNSTTGGNEMNTAADDNFDAGEVSLDALKNLADADVVTWHGHGGYDPTVGSYMGTGTLYTQELYDAYQEDIQAGRLVLSGNRFWITGGFIQKYVQDLSGHFLYLGTCSSGKDMVDNISTGSGQQRYELAQSFINKGATAVIANTAVISTNYNTLMERDVFARLCQTDSSGNYYTLSEALEYARSQNGQHDRVIYRQYGETDYAYAMIFPTGNAAANNYRLYQQGTLSGTVREAEHNQPVENALIRVYSMDGTTLIQSARTDGNGTYSVGLPAGNYVVMVTAGHYKSAKMAVTVTEGTTTYTETFLLLDAGLESGRASGRITNAVVSDQGVPGVTIRVRLGWNNARGQVLHTTTTSENGAYEISSLPSGDYTIEYAKSGFVTGYKNIVVSPLDIPSQNAVISPLTSEDEYRIVLSWTDHPSDLDSHLAGPLANGDRFHIYYPYADANNGSPYPDYVRLDLDNTSIRTRSDPETVTILKQVSGKYVYSVHDYSNGGNASSTEMSTSNAVVNVYRGNTLIATYHIPAGVPGTIWTVFELDGLTLTPVNRFGNGYSYDDASFDPYR